MNAPRTQPVVLTKRGPPQRDRDARGRGYTLLTLFGAAFALVGLADLLLLWLPVRFESLAWEFATVGRTLDALPMAALGLMLIGYAALGRQPSPRRLGAVAVLFGFMATLLVVLAILYLTSAPAVLAGTPAEAADSVRRAAIRHGIQAVVYPLVFAAGAVIAWRTR